MKSFAPKRDSHAMAPETAKLINESDIKVTVKQRARLDAKRGNHEINDRSVPESYQPYYRKAYVEMWNVVIDEFRDHENG